MNNLIDIIKGIHPGKFIERELRKQNLSQRALAEKTSIPFQTINAIIGGKRNLTTEQALKLDKTLNFEDGFFAILQTHYNIKQCKEKETAEKYSKAPQIRKSLFWDVDFNKINWAKHQKAVVKRVFERGNQREKDEITQYYNLSLQ